MQRDWLQRKRDPSQRLPFLHREESLREINKLEFHDFEQQRKSNAGKGTAAQQINTYF
jgi:hypothetical protein